MANIAVINNITGELINYIAAELTDECPEDHRFELIPDNTWWNGQEFVPYNSDIIKETPVEIE
jgi:hypothetical protein